MTDRPILMSAPMVLAILREVEQPGTGKTQTRRILTPHNTWWNGHPWTKRLKAQTWDWEKAWVDKGPSPAGNPGPYLHLPWLSGDDDQWEDTSHRIYPKVQPGTRLWVRETWRTGKSLDGASPAKIAAMAKDAGYRQPWCPIKYEADGDTLNANMLRYFGGEWGKTRVAIHMPRWASRLTDTVTDVRVQRLQEISDEDARAEGMPVDHLGNHYDPPPPEVDSWQGYGRASFALVWSELHGKESWDANPWVVAVTFRPERRNIDA